ncbi:4-hydroxyphenylacetate catabolism regulatory protein HpaA [Andreprevotia chitinilytica]|uniref:4-hydroxyphenylacetate catabolism regulatory protein HpaA n=1 Tax=Andreprevotia chitinilytica TaxID=396808 RepID=UPI00068BB078|nr:4-hydroxyphenylacetate catabolism regulatory protein HpaA [Andreprevotia chitinilytica]
MKNAAVAKSPIPNIDIGKVYDQRYADMDVHCEVFSRLAAFFGRNMPVHWHDRYFQVHYLETGQIRLNLEDRFHIARAPLIVLTPPTVPHAFVTESDSEGYVLTVRQELIWALLPTVGDWYGDPRSAQPACVELVQVPAEGARLSSLFRLLSDEFESERAGRADSLIMLARMVFLTLFRLAGSANRGDDDARVRGCELALFQRFNVLIEARFREHWTLTRYAAEIGVTETRLNHICRRVAGMPSKRVIHERLLQEAKRLLCFSLAPVSQVAYELGYTDPAYFSRFFSREAGVSPRDFRRGHGETVFDSGCAATAVAAA